MFSKYRHLPASLLVQPCDTPSSGPERSSLYPPCAVIIFGRYYCEALIFRRDPVSLLLSCLVTPLVTLPLEPAVVNVLPITGLAVATAPPTA